VTSLPAGRADAQLQPSAGAGELHLGAGQLDPGAGDVAQGHRQVRNRERITPPTLLSQIQVCRRLGISDETWRRWRAAGRVPVPVAVPGARLRWRVVDIERLEAGEVVTSGRRSFFGGARRHAARLGQ
jgi:predicted DNA-binding transcriptional regulator AlpA